jgi:hypothetical protein
MSWELLFTGITALGSIITPILVLILAGLGWTVRQSIERNQEQEVYLRELEEKLRDDRIAIYNKILEPFIILLTSDTAFQNETKYKNKTKQEVATAMMVSVDYRQTAFKLVLIGSDDVVKAYNDLMQFFYGRETVEANEDKGKVAFTTLKLLGQFLLEIRKSMGNRQSKLDNLEMLEWMMKDMKEIRKHA